MKALKSSFYFSSLFYGFSQRAKIILLGLTLHNEAAPTEELAAFGGNLNHSMERKKVYTKPVPKDFAKAWEKNDGEQDGAWGGQGQE